MAYKALVSCHMNYHLPVSAPSDGASIAPRGSGVHNLRNAPPVVEGRQVVGGGAAVRRVRMGNLSVRRSVRLNPSE